MSKDTVDKRIITALKECQVFSALSDAQLEKFAGAALEKNYEAGAAVFQDGDTAEELIIIQEGKIALQMTLSASSEKSSKRLTVDIAGRNDVIGWSSIVEPNIYTLSAVCLQAARVLSLSGEKIKALFKEDYRAGYEIVDGLLHVVAARLNDTRRVLISERSVPSA